MLREMHATAWLRLLAAILLLTTSAIAQTADPSEAQSLEKAGKFAEAAAAWRSVAQRDPRNAAAWASLGLVLSRLQEYSEAASAYRKALSLNSRLPGVQLNLGLAEFKQGHFEAAIPPLAAALAADPDSAQGRTLLGLSYYGAGRYDESSKYLALASKADPANRESGMSAARRHRGNGCARGGCTSRGKCRSTCCVYSSAAWPTGASSFPWRPCW